jgi:4-amino-4-deoxy-L-arabinose transferase-like glycosyltransferase
VFASTPYVVLGANVVTTDMLLATFELAAVAAWVEAWLGAPARRGAWLAAMWAAFGLAFMTKGPPGLVPLLPIVAFTALRADAPRWRTLLAPHAVALFLMVALAWFAVMVAQDPRLLDHFLRYEVAARLASGAHGRNPEWYAPFTIYGPTLLLGFLPWMLVAATWLRAAPAVFTRAFWRERLARAPFGAFLLLWVRVPLLAFCLARSRQWSYLLPLSAPIALLLGAHLAERIDPSRWRWRALLAVALAFPLALKYGLAHWPNPKDARRLAAALEAHADPGDYERIVFDRHWPYWGLTFYVPAPVLHIEKPQFSAPSAGVSVRTDRCAETVVVKHRELWISAARRAHEFRRDLAECDAGLVATHLGQHLGMVFFEVERPTPSPK